jgi:hypothetical protein
MSSRTAARLAALLLTGVSVAAPARAQEPGRAVFEGQQAAWRDAGGDARYRVEQHQWIQGMSPSGRGCEWLRLVGEGGSFVYFSREIGRPRVYEELAPSVWVKSDRAGLQLIARIVLPRTADSRTGRPAVTLISGPSYSAVGRWQQLRFDGMIRRLNEQIRVLHVELGPHVDGREAYVDALLLNVYGGPGVTNVWIGDLDVAGYVTVNEPKVERTTAPGEPAAGWNAGRTASAMGNAGPQPGYSETNVAAWNAGSAVAHVSAVEEKRPTVQMLGSELRVDGRPMLPRIVQHRGEPLEALKRLGFNAVWLERLPEWEVLEEAKRLGLWLVCPPPHPGPDDVEGRLPPLPMTAIGPQFDGVLAWNLGSNLAPSELEATRRWADQVRGADRHSVRPLICRPTSDLHGFSSVTDVLLADRRPLGTSLDLADYGQWLRKQALLARASTSIWATVQTQPSEALRRQLAALEPATPPPLSAPPEQIRLLAYTAIASGSRGLLFLSDTPLDASDPETRQRATALELLNLELELLEPWAAAGNFLTAAETNVAEVTGAMLRTDHARLLLPIWSAAGSQYVPPQSATNTLSLVVPGVPEGYSAFEITPSGVQPLRHNRGTGGEHVRLNEFGLTTQVLWAHDPTVIASVQRRAASTGREAAELQRQLAAHQLGSVQATAALLAPRTPIRQSAAWLESAQRSLQACNGQLAASDWAGAAVSAQRATRALRLTERAYWQAATKESWLLSPLTSPAAVRFDTLPLHWRFRDRIMTSRYGPNVLVGGDFEDLDTMLRAGWQHIQRPTPNVQSAADLVPEAAHFGRLGLRLKAAAEDPEHPPAVLELAPAMFVTPGVPVEAGQVVCIHGWVNVPASIVGNVDGLLVIDSFSGEALAERIQRTNGWRQFAMYRAATQSGTLSVIFALSGLGEARIDDVAIEVLQSAALTQR